MDYKTKIKHAEKAAIKLQEQKDIETIKSELKEEGFYDNDINKIMVSARKILGEKYQPKIKEYLLNNKQIHGAEEFSLLDREILDILISKESQSIALEEKNKITRLIKEGVGAEEVFSQVNTKFLDAEKAAQHIAHCQGIKKQNSGSGRMINIFGGIGLIVLTGILLVTINRIFYVLPIIGLVMIMKGFLTQKMD